MSLTAKKLIRRGLCRGRYADIGCLFIFPVLAPLLSVLVRTCTLFVQCYDEDQVSWLMTLLFTCASYL